jgi:hypothetical protein
MLWATISLPVVENTRFLHPKILSHSFFLQKSTTSNKNIITPEYYFSDSNNNHQSRHPHPHNLSKIPW